jgi:type I restriction enzyme, S subunit
MKQSWPEVDLGDVLTLKRGYDLPNNDRRDGRIPIVSSSGISGYHDEAKVNGPGVITGRYGTLGEVFLVNEPYWPLNTTLYVQNFKGNDPAFISYFLRTLNLASQNAAGAVPGLNRNALHMLKVRIPPLPTQRKIAVILSVYDNLIKNNTRRVRVLEDMARALYREWFVEYRYPDHETAEFVEDEHGRRPRGWEWLEMGQICDRITDGSHKSPPSQAGGLPMASVKDMNDWGLDLESCRHVSDADFAELVRNDCKPRINDVLIAKDGSYLKHTFVVEREQDVVILSSIAILRPRIERIQPFYLALHLRQHEVRERLKGYVSGVAIPRIVLKDFRKFKILVPLKEHQDEFETLIKPVRAQIHSLIVRNANLRRTRDLLLPRLVSGELNVSNLEIRGTAESMVAEGEAVA